VSRYHPSFALDRYFAGVTPGAAAPVLEVVLPLEERGSAARLGFAQYLIDARTLGGELAAIEDRLGGQTRATLALGTGLIGLVLAGLYAGLASAQRAVAERNERLARANFELTLAAKASVLGQITSHLVHGLQGSVAGLRAVVAGGAGNADWDSAAGYTDRMQSLISETVALLGDPGAGAGYTFTGDELAAIIRDRNAATAAAADVRLVVGNLMTGSLDGQSGSLLCLIAANLIGNAVAATPAGGRVIVELAEDRRSATLTVADEGGGIPGEIRARLFEPGASSRPGGTGLGLAISRLLARQIGGELTLVSTGETGTTFRVTLARPA
jgi:signal transduction histidine kinase